MITSNRVVADSISNVFERLTQYPRDRIILHADYAYIIDWMYPDCHDGSIYVHFMRYHRSQRDSVSNFDTTRIVCMSDWFMYCRIAADISRWDVGNVIRMIDTFYNASFAPGLDSCINSWRPLSLKSMYNAFKSSGIFNSGEADISEWKPTSLEVLSFAFSKTNFDINQLRKWNFSDMTNTHNTFRKMSNIVNIAEIIDIISALPEKRYVLSQSLITGIKEMVEVCDQAIVAGILYNSYILPSEWCNLVRYYRGKHEYAEVYKILTTPGESNLFNQKHSCMFTKKQL